MWRLSSSLRYTFFLMFIVNTAYAVSKPRPTTRAPSIDQNLHRWLETLTPDAQPRSFTAGTYDRSLLKQQTISDFVQLIQSEDDEITSAHISKFRDRRAYSHPLAPYFWQEANSVEEQQNRFNIENLDRYFPSRSCPRKKVLHEIIDNKQKYSFRELRKIFPQVSKSFSSTFKLRAFTKILRTLHKTNTPLPTDLVFYLREFPHLLLSFRSIMPANVTASVPARIDYLLRDRQCSRAYVVLKNSNLDLHAFQSSAMQTANCYRRHRRLNQLKFWRSIRNVMRKKFGFRGWATASTRIARLHRQRDKFRAAKSLLQKVLHRAERRKLPKIQDTALFMLAEVYEDAGNTDLAARLFQKHTAQFPLSKHRNKALKASALISIMHEKWEKAHHALERLRKAQDGLPRDARAVDVLGFALLWQGRTYLELGKVELAVASWSRLLREFFSSYYGALAHYMLEKLTGKNVILSPSSDNSFSERMLYDAFAHKEQEQIARTLYLLRLGLVDEAVCEIAEHPANNNAQMFTKSLLLHVAGRWTESISIFTKIDRSYRETLPAGSEKILFPKRFEGEIFSYARKADIDPFFVMALIRQESIFNPKARSAAGARGVMQIMPKTALHETKRLKKYYVSSAKKRKIRRAVRRSKNNLYDVSTNVLLGVHYLHRLLDKYKDTVHTLSSYNAGITPTNRWLKTFPSTDPMLFISKIPYSETKNYVKLVLRNYFYYKRWYGDNSPSDHDYLNPMVSVALRLL